MVERFRIFLFPGKDFRKILLKIGVFKKWR